MKDGFKELSIDKGTYGNGGWKCHKCSCGREFCYTKDMEKEQADCLFFRGVTEFGHPVQVVQFPEDGARVVGCECWLDQAKELAGSDHFSDHQQAVYDHLKNLVETPNEIALVD